MQTLKIDIRLCISSTLKYNVSNCHELIKKKLFRILDLGSQPAFYLNTFVAVNSGDCSSGRVELELETLSLGYLQAVTASCAPLFLLHLSPSSKYCVFLLLYQVHIVDFCLCDTSIHIAEY